MSVSRAEGLRGSATNIKTSMRETLLAMIEYQEKLNARDKRRDECSEIVVK